MQYVEYISKSMSKNFKLLFLFKRKMYNIEMFYHIVKSKSNMNKGKLIYKKILNFVLNLAFKSILRTSELKKK